MKDKKTIEERKTMQEVIEENHKKAVADYKKYKKDKKRKDIIENVLVTIIVTFIVSVVVILINAQYRSNVDKCSKNHSVSYCESELQ